MHVEIALDLFKLDGPVFNQLESLMVEGLTRHNFNNYIRIKKKLCKYGIILTQILGDLWFFRIDKKLSITKFIQKIEEILSHDYITHQELENLKVRHSNYAFQNTFYHKNQIIPNILKEAFLCTLSRESLINCEVEYIEKAVFIPNLGNKIVGFKFQFSIDERFGVYMFLDLIYDIEFKSSSEDKSLPRSFKRIKDYESFKDLISKLSFFCGGKKYYLNPEIMTFKKIIEEREC
ncbi:MAG: hypothetical protein ACFFG0_24940 [Candidatus Thorarchaeota archaeon]